MVNMFQEKMAGDGNDPDDLILQAFMAYDQGGKIDVKMFQHALTTWGDEMTKAEIDDIFNEFEIDQSSFFCITCLLYCFQFIQRIIIQNTHIIMKTINLLIMNRIYNIIKLIIFQSIGSLFCFIEYRHVIIFNYNIIINIITGINNIIHFIPIFCKLFIAIFDYKLIR